MFPLCHKFTCLLKKTYYTGGEFCLNSLGNLPDNKRTGYWLHLSKYLDHQQSILAINHSVFFHVLVVHDFLSYLQTVSSIMNSMVCCGDWLVSTMVISLPSIVMVGTVMA